MSDFLDRLAARAGDGATALAPRLPSLFEPPRRAPVMPLAEEAEAAAEPPHASPPSTAPAVVPLPSPYLVEPPRAEAPRALQASRAVAAAPLPPPVVPSPPSPPAPVAVAAPRQRDAEPVAALRVPERVTAERPSPPSVSPRQTLRVPEHPPTATTRVEVGSLLPAAAPVFATPIAAGPSRATAAAAARAATGAGQRVATAEPVVHVSIGRIEVRAAPAAAAPPRRRDGPQPGSLDDYLRQRGKATP